MTSARRFSVRSQRSTGAGRRSSTGARRRAQRSRPSPRRSASAAARSPARRPDVALWLAALSTHEGSRRMFIARSFPAIASRGPEGVVLVVGVDRGRVEDEPGHRVEHLLGRRSGGLRQVSPDHRVGDHHERTYPQRMPRVTGGILGGRIAVALEALAGDLDDGRRLLGAQALPPRAGPGAAGSASARRPRARAASRTTRSATVSVDPSRSRSTPIHSSRSARSRPGRRAGPRSGRSGPGRGRGRRSRASPHPSTSPTSAPPRRRPGSRSSSSRRPRTAGP